jgi:hypothetical protein
MSQESYLSTLNIDGKKAVERVSDHLTKDGMQVIRSISRLQNLPIKIVPVPTTVMLNAIASLLCSWFTMTRGHYSK